MIRRCLLALALAVASPAFAESIPAADPVGIRGDFSGNWYNPAQPGHGLSIEVRDGGKATLAWYTFDANGNAMWLFGNADIEGGALRATVSRSAGGRFPPAFNPATVVTAPWGELLLTFTGCNSGTLTWTPTAAGFDAGQMPISRLTSVHGTRCNEAEEFSEVRHWSLERGNQDFEALFADLPPGENQFYELDYVYEALPPPLTGRRGMRLSGNNHSDDLAMLVKREVKGLAPEATYRIELDAEIASDIPTGCAGIGGSPGDSVYMKLGASTAEPFAVTRGDDGWLRLTIDYGQQSNGGANAIVVDTLANSHSCDNGTEAPWELRTLTTKGTEFRMRTDAEGALWILVGSDSGFEGRSDWYLTAVTLRLQRVTDVGPLR